MHKNGDNNNEPIEIKPGIYVKDWPPFIPTIVDMRLVQNRSFPKYVKFVRLEPIDEGLTVAYLEICGEEYRYHPTDMWIEPAIFLASIWDDGEQTYERITILRNWLRENYQHGHRLNVSHLRTMKDCLNFILELIALENPIEIVAKEEFERLVNQHTLIYSDAKN
jgi:hypothetical protein